MNQLIFLLLGLCLLIKSFGFDSDWEDEFDYATYLDEDEQFRLYWTNLDDDIVDFGIEANATGWIALGVSPNGQMPNSDIAFGWVDDTNGDVYLEDRYTEGRSTPLYDDKQNLTLISGEEMNGWTRIRFERPMFSCDDDQDLSLSIGTSRYAQKKPNQL